MDIHAATEAAYKNGYEAGCKAFGKAIKTKLEEISSCGLIDEYLSIMNGYVNEIAKQLGVDLKEGSDGR